MKLRLWHVILQEMVNVSSGQKNLKSWPIYVLENFLSLPIAFFCFSECKPISDIDPQLAKRSF